MTAPSPAGASDLTRRQALKAGGATAAAAYVFLNPWVASAFGADASGSVPKHLLRSSYADLANAKFATDQGVMSFEGVFDLPAAAQVPSFVDSEDAFALVFSGPETSEVFPVAMRHSELGAFDMFLGPRSDEGRYTVVVNRVLSNRESRRTPPRPQRHSDPPAPPADEGLDTRTGSSDDDAKGARRVRRRNKVIRSVETKRTKRGAKVVVQVDRSANLRELTGWLGRDQVVVATASRRVQGKRVAMNLKPGKRLRKGIYQLTLIAHDRDGEQYSRRVRVRLR